LKRRWEGPISQENVGRVRDAYDALGRGEPGPLVALLHADIEWIEPDGAPGVGAMTRGSGVYRGRDDVLNRMFGRLPSIWNDFGVHPTRTPHCSIRPAVVLGEVRASVPGAF
jgi:ketosteroid isomerase-like protein